MKARFSGRSHARPRIAGQSAELERHSQCGGRDRPVDRRRCRRSVDTPTTSAEVFAPLAPCSAQRHAGHRDGSNRTSGRAGGSSRGPARIDRRGHLAARSGAMSRARPARAESPRGAGWRSSRCRSTAPQAGSAETGSGEAAGRLGASAFDQDSGDLSAADADVVGPLDPGIAAGPGGNDLGGRDRPQRGQPGAPSAAGGVARHQMPRREKQDRHQDRRSRRGRPGPAAATPPRSLFFGQDRPGRRWTRRLPARAARSLVLVTRFQTTIRRPTQRGRELVFDLIGTEPLGRGHVGTHRDTGAARSRTQKRPGTSDRRRTCSRFGPSSQRGT